MADLIGRTLGPYRIEEEIGAGNVATVYRAYRAPLDVYVAVKVLRDDAAREDEVVWRFLRQARVTARLTHPNIVSIHRLQQEGGLCYVAMDYVAGPSLAQKLKDEGPLPPAEALAILRQVAAALDFAHAQRVLHCNLTPANILLAPNGRAVLTDFAPPEDLADPQLWKVDLRVGRAEYMSPEQAGGQALDPRSDLYSLGVVLYEMLTARVPFEAETPQGVLDKHLHEAPPAPSLHNPGLRPAVDRVAQRALTKEKKKRYQSGGQMARALAKAIGVPAGASAAEGLLLETGPRRLRRAFLGLGLGMAAVAIILGALSSQRPPAPLPTARPTELRLVSSATPMPTPAITQRPSVTATSGPPSPTPSPTATTTPTTTPVPTATRRLLTTPTRLLLATAYPGLVVAPVLEAPADGSGLNGAVTFRWRWDRVLQADEYFDLRVWRLGTPHYGIAWTREPFYVYTMLEPGNYDWSVAVIRATGDVNPDGSKAWEPVSEESETWSFSYAMGGPSRPGPTPTPPTPTPPP